MCAVRFSRVGFQIPGRSRRGRSDFHLRRLPGMRAPPSLFLQPRCTTTRTPTHHLNGASRAQQRRVICGKPGFARNYLQLRHLPGDRRRSLRDIGKQQGIPQRLGRRRRHRHATLDRRVLARRMWQASSRRRLATVARERCGSPLTRHPSRTIPSPRRTATGPVPSVCALGRSSIEEDVRHSWARRGRPRSGDLQNLVPMSSDQAGWRHAGYGCSAGEFG